jgi:hypothetical protein
MGKLREVLGNKDADSFMKFCNDVEDGVIEKSTIMEFEGDFSEKNKRTAVHTLFKASLKKYETDTLSLGELRKIRVFLKSGLGKNKR